MNMNPDMNPSASVRPIDYRQPMFASYLITFGLIGPDVLLLNEPGEAIYIIPIDVTPNTLAGYIWFEQVGAVNIITSPTGQINAIYGNQMISVILGHTIYCRQSFRRLYVESRGAAGECHFCLHIVKTAVDDTTTLKYAAELTRMQTAQLQSGSLVIPQIESPAHTNVTRLGPPVIND